MLYYDINIEVHVPLGYYINVMLVLFYKDGSFNEAVHKGVIWVDSRNQRSNISFCIFLHIRRDRRLHNEILNLDVQCFAVNTRTSRCITSELLSANYRFGSILNKD